MECPIQPVGRHVVVEHVQRDQVERGIIIPEQACDSTQLGNVLAVGPKARDVEPGQQVAFSKYAGEVFLSGGRSLVVLAPHEILAVVE